ncbi:MAG: hypothetical protein LBV19_00515 [Streptococcaceae bacterium]|jgi:hypothetical protein|nr:hypothetical protein [Streptococcaceae bacterium]
MSDVSVQSSANVSITEDGILVKYGKYVGQKSRAMAGMVLLLTPVIAILLMLAIFPFFKILALTILAIGIIVPLGLILLKYFIQRSQIKEGTWNPSDNDDVFGLQPKALKNYFFRNKNEHPAPYKLSFDGDTLTWYPRLNSEIHVEIPKSDIQEIDFGWGAFRVMSPLLATAWKISHPGVMAPHAASITRESEEGWISIVFKNSKLASKWLNPFNSWIDPHNANLEPGGILIMEKGFDMSYKDLKLISESMEYHFGLPVKQYDQINKRDFFE